MFKGMKQEQNTSLHQLFPDWNRDCLDFLAQCLKMDGNQRPETTKLLKHDLFTRDKFVEAFLVELKGKLAQEMVGNPLLKRMPSYGSGRKMVDDKRITEKVVHKKSGDESKLNNGKDKISQIGLSLLSTQLLNSTNFNSKNGTTDTLSKGTPNNEDTMALSSLKQSMNNPPKPTHKGISINNLVFKESGKNYRVLSAKPAKSSTISEKSSSTNFDVQIQPPSPAQFQSLQSEITNEINQQKRLSPVSINNLSINGNFPQYFSHKKSSNILGLHQVSQKTNIKQNNHNALNTARPSLVKRERPHIDLGLIPLGLGTTSETTKELSPRILPPPPWLTSSNIKVNTHGKSTQITKRSLTDWKSVGTITGTAKSNIPSEANEFLLPNCPGATSPLKGNRKKLSPMINFSDTLFGSVSAILFMNYKSCNS